MDTPDFGLYNDEMCVFVNSEVCVFFPTDFFEL